MASTDHIFSRGFGLTVLVVIWIECAISTLMMAMRLYTTGFVLRKWRADFWWAALTYVLCLLATIFATIAVVYGLGEHLEDLLATHPELIAKNQYWQWVYTTVIIISTCTGKLTIIAFILHIEDTTTGARKWILYVLAAGNICVNAAIIPIIWTQCTPTAKMWEVDLPGNCNGRNTNEKYGFFQGSFGAFVDLCLALYPILIFKNLKLDLQVRIGLIVLFGFGVVACACSIVKTVELSTLTAVSDITYQLSKLDIWAATEMHVIFIVSCIPLLRPLFVSKFGFGRSFTNRTPSNAGYIQQKNTIDGTRSSAYASRSSTRVKYDAKGLNSLSEGKDTESQEVILPEHDGIMLTSQVVVTYDDLEAGKTKALDGEV